MKRNSPPRIDWYFQKGRGTKSAGPITKLKVHPGERGFIEAVEAAAGISRHIDPLSVRNLVDAFRGRPERGIEPSPEWSHLKARTRADYSIYLEKIIVAWGELKARDITIAGAYAFRDALADTPVAANHAISIARTLFQWGIPRGFVEKNVFKEVSNIKVEHDTAEPWPEEGYRYVLEKGPENLRRMAILGRATGQRASDLVTMRPMDILRGGIKLKISKLRGRDHWVPLTTEALAEISSWTGDEDKPFLVSSSGNAFTPDHLNSRWNRWKATEDGAPIRQFKMTIHDLRATAVCDRRMAGLTHQEISAQICMSLDMVIRYSRKIDQEALAKAAMDRLERNSSGGA